MDGASMQGDTMKRIGATMLREIREAVPATIFFLWLFHMIALTKAVTLGDYSITALRATVATVGALIVAKAILIVEALPISRIFSRQLWFHVLWKTLLFNVVVLIFRFIEEIIHLVRKHESLSMGVAQLYSETVWPQFWVFQLWLFCALFLYCVAAEIVRTVGAERIKAMLFKSGGSAPQG
jgi:hypothetical protein